MRKEIIEKAKSNYQLRSGKGLMPKAVLFDMDGVLYDSMRFHESLEGGGRSLPFACF